MPLRISAIIQLGYPLLNTVGHFMDRLNTKTHPPLYKTYMHIYWFCNATVPYSPSHYSPFSLPLHASHFTEHLNNAFNNKVSAHNSKCIYH